MTIVEHDFEAGGKKLARLFELWRKREKITKSATNTDGALLVGKGPDRQGGFEDVDERAELFGLLVQSARTLGRELANGALELLIQSGVPYPLLPFEQRLAHFASTEKGGPLLEALVQGLAAAATRGSAAAHGELEDQAESTLAGPESALGEILALVPAWVTEAAQAPREPGSAQDRMLAAAKRYTLELREAGG